jgi:photosystem II stability/assembly factor-like uncharacterized protein
VAARTAWGVLPAVVAALAAGSSLGTPHPGQHGVRPTSLAFADARHGFLSASTECGPSACRSGAIYGTSDGGASWRLLRRLSEPVSDLVVAGKRHVWAAVARCEGRYRCRHGGLVRSADGGLTWRLISRRVLTSPAFADTHHGLAAAGAKIVATADGGLTWRPVHTPCVRGLALNAAVSFPIRGRAWTLCAGQPGTGQQGKGVYRSDDDGRTWKALAEARCDVEVKGIPEPRCRSRGLIGGYGYAIAISMTARGRGVITETRGTLLLTLDGGRTWRAPTVSQAEIDFGIDAQQVSQRVVVALLERGGGNVRLVASADGGRTWRTVHRWQRT